MTSFDSEKNNEAVSSNREKLVEIITSLGYNEASLVDENNQMIEIINNENPDSVSKAILLRCCLWPQKFARTQIMNRHYWPIISELLRLPISVLTIIR